MQQPKYKNDANLWYPPIKMETTVIVKDKLPVQDNSKTTAVRVFCI